MHKDYSYESTDSLRENNLQTEGDYVEEIYTKKHNFITDSNNLLD